jgi:hypothetical protein
MLQVATSENREKYQILYYENNNNNNNNNNPALVSSVYVVLWSVPIQKFQPCPNSS